MAMSVGRSVGPSVSFSFLAAFIACRGSNLVKYSSWMVRVIQLFSSIQCMQQLFLAQSSLVQTSVDQFSLLQSNLVKSCQIQSNLEKSFLGYFWQHIAHVVDLYSLVQSDLDQCRSIQSTLVKSSQILSNLVKSRKIFSGLLLAAYIAYSGFL